MLRIVYIAISIVCGVLSGLLVAMIAGTEDSAMTSKIESKATQIPVAPMPVSNVTPIAVIKQKAGSVTIYRVATEYDGYLYIAIQPGYPVSITH